MNPNDLMHQYLLGNLDEDGVRQLDQLLADDAELRRQFRLAAEMDAALREASLERSIEDAQQRVHPPVSRLQSAYGVGIIAACAALAASMLIAVTWWNRQPDVVATLASSEDAAWESTLPTSPGSKLAAGTLHLKSGIATIEFRSGAELVIEAPAQLELVSAMRARLDAGSAALNVPDSATGFVLETPEGYAVDYGTRFVVDVDPERRSSDFELIEGEIEVHHPASGQSLRLNHVGAAASVSNESMQLRDDVLQDEPTELSVDSGPRLVRVATHGRCGTAIRNFARRKKAVLPEYLYAKNSTGTKWDIRSFFEFDLSNIELDQINAARLRLNLVPSYRGSASLLPKINRFAVYGLTNPAKADWQIETTWENSPGPEDGVLLGTFEIPRSRQRGTFGIDGEALLEFLQDQGDRPVTLILVRETKRVSGAGAVMTHMFASDQHPESVGPLLELTSDR